MREILRGAELPAQWQKYSLRTQQEMMAGRDALDGMAIYRWVDEGIEWLNKQFGDKLEFSTALDSDQRKVRLAVYSKQPPLEKKQRHKPKPPEVIFTVVEPVESFVSHLTVTKLILIAG